eukprot:10372792-Lingulodinium_polyedra.AAC.1
MPLRKQLRDSGHHWYSNTHNPDSSHECGPEQGANTYPWTRTPSGTKTMATMQRLRGWLC